MSSFSVLMLWHTHAYSHPNGDQNEHITSLKIDHIFLENIYFEALFPTGKSVLCQLFGI